MGKGRYVPYSFYRMWRLVIAHILPGDVQAIERIVHERDVTFGGRYLRHIDVDDAVVVVVAVDDLLAPVTKEVGLQAGR